MSRSLTGVDQACSISWRLIPVEVMHGPRPVALQVGTARGTSLIRPPPPVEPYCSQGNYGDFRRGGVTSTRGALVSYEAVSDACADPPTRKTAVRQAIAKGIVSFYQKYVDELSKRDIKETFIQVLFLSSSPPPPCSHTVSKWWRPRQIHGGCVCTHEVKRCTKLVFLFWCAV